LFHALDTMMFSSFSRRMQPRILAKLSQSAPSLKSSPVSLARVASQSTRLFSSQIPPNNPQANFQPKAPSELNIEIAEGIQNANSLILKYGVGSQRLALLATSEDPLVLKWQRMMEIYLGAQLHVIASLGYETNEQGIMRYTQQLAQFIEKCDPATQDSFRRVGRDTWRVMLATAFDLDEELLESVCGEELSIVDARNTVHKVASKLMEPKILETVAKKCSVIPQGGDPQQALGTKHQIIQDVVVNEVYLGGSPSLVEELGFGSGAKGYAVMQYAMAYHENDPLCMQYTSSAMVRIWEAAGLDLSGNPAAVKLPMSLPSA